MAHWEYTVNLGDIWKKPGMSWQAQRDQIVKRIRANRWYRECEHDGLGELVEALATVGTIGQFDKVWNRIYDQANYDRAWIDLQRPGVMV